MLHLPTPHCPSARHACIAAFALCTLLLTGCCDQRELTNTKAELIHTKADNRRLARELSVTKQTLEHYRRAEISRARRPAPAPTPPAASSPRTQPEHLHQHPHPHPHPGQPSAPLLTGNWLVVLASIGSQWADEQQQQFSKWASTLNANKHSEHGRFTTRRLKQSGGLQLIFAGHGSQSVSGVNKDEARRIRDLVKQEHRYREAYITRLQ